MDAEADLLLEQAAASVSTSAEQIKSSCKQSETKSKTDENASSKDDGYYNEVYFDSSDEDEEGEIVCLSVCLFD